MIWWWKNPPKPHPHKLYLETHSPAKLQKPVIMDTRKELVAQRSPLRPLGWRAPLRPPQTHTSPENSLLDVLLLHLKRFFKLLLFYQRKQVLYKMWSFQTKNLILCLSWHHFQNGTTSRREPGRAEAGCSQHRTVLFVSHNCMTFTKSGNLAVPAPKPWGGVW